MTWTPLASRPQEALPSTPYDRWISANGVCMAEFHRVEAGYLIRFPNQADFKLELSEQGFRVSAWPLPEVDGQSVHNLYHNAIQPILGNHAGGLFLHGSAVMIAAEVLGVEQPGAIAFLGLSRAGKTTIAGSFALAGNPFLTEDVIDLDLRDGQYWLQPKRAKLRLFADSARHLLGQDRQFSDNNFKQDVDADTALPFAKYEVPLKQIYILGNDHGATLNIQRFSMAEALRALMPHAFILDVEDKSRLQGHFTRMADLSQDIACFALDFTRDYGELHAVRAAVLENFSNPNR